MQSETPRQLDLDNYLPALITWVNNKYAADSSRIYRKRFGIGISDWRVLAYLGVKGTGTGAEMSEFLGMDKAAISRSVQFLGNRGYVELAEQKGRRSLMRLTDTGVALYNDVLDVAVARAEALLNGLDEEERKTLFDLIHRVHDNIPDVIALFPDDAEG